MGARRSRSPCFPRPWARASSSCGRPGHRTSQPGPRSPRSGVCHDLAPARRRGAHRRTPDGRALGARITNVIVEVDSAAEVPILDGSGASFVRCCGRRLAAGGKPFRNCRQKTVSVGDRRAHRAAAASELVVDYRGEGGPPASGRQRFMGPLTSQRFITAIAPPAARLPGQRSGRSRRSRARKASSEN